MIFKLLLLVIFSHSLIASVSTGSGGWISSGGKSFFDAKNPWFLKGQSVTYCLEVDRSGVSTDKAQAQQALELAIAYWQKEFASTTTLGGALTRYNGFALGNNLFIPSPGLNCQGTEDLRILMGAKSLSQEERKYLGAGIKNYIGVAVRTSYDRKQLRGKGFIYISSDIGPERHLDREGSITSPWRHNKLLAWTLVHELGHVFGVPHTGSSFMSEVFMDLLLSKYYYRDFIKHDFEPFIAAPKQFTKCGVLPATQLFFSLKPAQTCLVGKWQGDRSFDIYTIDRSGQREKVASIVSLQTNFTGIKARPISYLRLTDQQQIFTPQQLNYRSLIPGPLQERYNMRGKIILYHNSSSLPVHIDISPESMSINSLQNGVFKTIFSYDSPITFTLSQVMDIVL